MKRLEDVGAEAIKAEQERFRQRLKDVERAMSENTIASLKGGEADVIMLLPGIGAAGQAAYLRDGARRDSGIRPFCVGLTRARETVHICARGSAIAVRL